MLDAVASSDTPSTATVPTTLPPPSDSPAPAVGPSSRTETGSHDLPVTAALAALMRTGWATPDATSVGAPTPVAQYTSARRDRLSAAYPGERLIVPSGSLVRRSNDQHYAFRPHSDYVWLTGDQSSDAVLVLEPVGNRGHEPVLYVRPRASREESDEFWRSRTHGEFWAGRRASLAELAAATGLSTRHLDDLPDALTSGVPSRVRRGVDPRIDALVDTRPDADDRLAATLAELRLVKDGWEIAELRAAVQITADGFDDAVRELDTAVRLGPYGERWIEGTFWRRARYAGNDVGYLSIVAGGAHATTLHWIAGTGELRPGDLLLLDMGAETRSLYTADITRTLPIGGRFTDVQADLYQLVLDAQSAGIAAVRPGARFRDFHRAAMTVIAHGLADLGLLPCPVEQALDEDSTVYRRWTLCSSGHMLGLDVHDCAHARATAYLDGVLEPGQVLTVEPGLYLQADDLLVPEELRGIGIRIEDDVLVTDTGNDVLSAQLPREIPAIHEWLAT